MSWFSLLLAHNGPANDNCISKALSTVFHHEAKVQPDAAPSAEELALDEAFSAADTTVKDEPPLQLKKRLVLPCGRKLEVQDDENANKSPDDTLNPQDSTNFLLFLAHNGNAAPEKESNLNSTADSMISSLNSTFRHEPEVLTTTDVWCPVRGVMKYSLDAAKDIEADPDVRYSAPRAEERSTSFLDRDNTIDFMNSSVLQRCAKKEAEWRRVHAERRAIAATKNERMQQNLTRSFMALEKAHSSSVESRSAMAARTSVLEQRLRESEERAREARERMARVIPGMEMYLRPQIAV
mmetsp:Transcript_24094/g.48324  ORF Transcript_24094/g.48324 Transcript_24094/m.48324 type:complete len:295 (-) Transcript_24094:70-954(-)|eukprot:CAMPEP_0196760638 /NCGR_PEP_ID=MMETSP1091-20130531/105332_1 /TAXON_ID=302021 /ORGANISM="Rhodomonas sp., Strain CCMP768" /LENGTH=294 /DNA_ID=CAMNT_0042109551 /DNA_START=35 /DNA_END=919 /DNA_ORIENTATION=+